jgi:uncharacterized membrane protein YeaQ/YmgE (transglycosylase-associated protein family)
VICQISVKFFSRLPRARRINWEALSMDMTSIITQLVIGAIGGNGAGAVLKNQSLGTLGNTIAGVVGGGLGGQILGSLMNHPMADAAAGAVASGGGSLVQNIAGGGIGGAVLMVVVGIIKGMMNKQA